MSQAIINKGRVCCAPNCCEPARCGGKCIAHYQRFRRYNGFDLPPKPTARERFEEKCQPIPELGCWAWTHFKRPDGYGEMTYKGRARYAQKVAWDLFRGPIPKNLHVLHTCDNRWCVNPDHLFLGTNRDNVNDKLAKGRQPWGSQIHQSKLTKEQVLSILNDARTQRAIAEDYNICQQTVSQIKRRQSWQRLAPV